MPDDTTRLKRLAGRNIRARRDALGISREKLAEQMEVSQQYVAKCENGTQNLTIESLVKFANVLGTTVVALLTARD